MKPPCLVLALALAALCLLLLLPQPTRAQLSSEFRVRLPEGSPVPALFDQTTAFLLTGEGRVKAVDRSSGRERWTARVRCGSDVFALTGDQIVCARGRHGQLRIIESSTGRLLAHDHIEGGPYVPRLVDRTLTMLNPRTGRILGYDVERRTWAFDHRTDMDLSPGGGYLPVGLGKKLYFTEDEWRTLWAVNVHDGKIALAARSDTPVRTDEGVDAFVTHGLLISSDHREIVAFDLVAGRRAWRVNADTLGGRPLQDSGCMTVAEGSLFLLIAKPAVVGAAWTGHEVVEVRLHNGEIRRRWSLAFGLPGAAVLPLLTTPPDSPCALAFRSLVIVKGCPALTLASACTPREAGFDHGWVIGLDHNGGGVAWSTPPKTGTRLVPSASGVFALWGQSNVPHSERRITELNPETGALRTEHTTSYTPTWAVEDDDQLWLGTEGGPVFVFGR